jgi:hypothetical protein
MLESRWLRIALFLANLSIVGVVLERRSLGPRSPGYRENPALTPLYDFFDIPGAFFVVAALGLAVAVAEFVQRLQTDRPLFGPDGRHASLAVQVIAPAPFAIAFTTVAVIQVALTVVGIALLFFGFWLLMQVLSG